MSFIIKTLNLLRTHGIFGTFRLAVSRIIFYTKRKYKYHCNRLLPACKRPSALKQWYFKETGEQLHLESPQSYNDKIQWFKLYGVTPLISQLSDKYRVRDWVSQRIGDKYLVPLLGVWDSVDEIDFDKLPQRFVLKENHGCGYNVLVKDKSSLNIQQLKKILNQWLKIDFAFVAGFEMQYHNIPRKIIAEAYLENENSDLYDYKAYCFNGKCEFIEFISNRSSKPQLSFYDREWNRVNISTGTYASSETLVPKPDNLEELLQCVEKLAEGFAHVRVDFYRLNDGSLYFGEMTFTPCSGKAKWQPDGLGLSLGQKFKYPGMTS